MQITVEKVVWIALVLVVVAVVGLFLMGQVLTASQQVGQRFYVRLISSQHIDSTKEYVVSFRLVNSGEAGANMVGIEIKPIGFGDYAQVIPISPSDGFPTGDGATAIPLDPPVPPKGTIEVTVKISSSLSSPPSSASSKSLVESAIFLAVTGYGGGGESETTTPPGGGPSSGTKVLVITAHFSDDTQAAQSLEIP